MNDEHNMEPELEELLRGRELPDGSPRVREHVLAEAKRRSESPAGSKRNVVSIAVMGLMSAAAALVLMVSLPDGREAPSRHETPGDVAETEPPVVDDDAGERLEVLRNRIGRIRETSDSSEPSIRPAGELLKKTRELRIELADAAPLTPTESPQ